MTHAPALRTGVITPRTAVVLLAGDGIRYRLPTPLDWTLEGTGGQRTGVAGTVALFLDDLEPASAYSLSAGGARILEVLVLGVDDGVGALAAVSQVAGAAELAAGHRLHRASLNI